MEYMLYIIFWMLMLVIGVCFIEYIRVIMGYKSDRNINCIKDDLAMLISICFTLLFFICLIYFNLYGG